MSRPQFLFDTLEPRHLLTAAFDLIDLTELRADPQFAGIDGSDVSVAVIDTGIGTHQLLSGAVVAREDFVRRSSSSDHNDDENGHGTHVAGTIGARSVDIGVANAVNLIALKVGGLDGSGSVSSSAVERAFQWVLDHRTQYNIAAVNMSVGGGFYSTDNFEQHPYFDDVQELEEAGVSVIAAAGNEYDVNKRPGSSAPGVFATLNVGAVYDENEGRVGRAGLLGRFEGDRTTAGDRTVYFSHRPNTDNVIFAPGAMITSTVPGNDFDDKPGTSMAAPHVSGVVALMQEAAKQFGGRYLRPTEVRDLIVISADNIVDGDDEDTTVPTTGQAYPRVNAHKAVSAVKAYFQGGDPGTPPAPAPNTTDPDGLIADASRLNVTQNPLVEYGIIGNDGATLGDDGTVTGGTEVGAADVDIYELLVPDSGILEVDIDTRPDVPGSFPGRSHVNSHIRIFTAAGTEIASNDNAVDASETSSDGHNTDSYLAINVTGGLRYFVAVSGAHNTTYSPTSLSGRNASGTGGYYQLQFTYRNRDLNGSIPQATGDWTIDVSGGRTQYLAGILGADGGYSNVVGDRDVDFNHINSPLAGILEIDIDSTEIEGNTRENLPGWIYDMYEDPVDSVIHLWSADGTLLASVDDVEHYDPVLRYPIAPGVDYYVSVSGYGNDHFDPLQLGSGSSGDTGNYAMKVTLRNPGDTTALSDGDVRNPAVRTIMPDVQLTGNIGVDNGLTIGDTDVDFYRFVPPQDGYATFLTRDINDFDADTFLRVFGADGTELGYNDDTDQTTGSSRLTVLVRKGVTYYVGVNGSSTDARNYDLRSNNAASGATGEYGLEVSLEVPPPDLAVNVTSVGLFDTVVPGDRGRVGVQIRNLEPGKFARDVSVDLYLSTDDTLGGDVLIGSVTRRFSLKTGRARNVNLRAFIPPNAPTGNYNILASVDASNVIAETNEGNNVAVAAGQRTLAWRFGTFDDRRNVRLMTMDSAGTIGTFSLKGPGFGDVSRNLEGLFNLVFVGTDLTSSARVTTDGGAMTVNDIYINGALRGLTATSADFVGEVVATGTHGPFIFRNKTVA